MYSLPLVYLKEMPKRWWCFGSLIIITVLFISYYMRISIAIESLDGRIRKWDEGADHSMLNTLKEFEKIHGRWRSSGGGTKSVKTILYWNEMYVEKHKHFMFGTGDVFQGCPVPHCYGTPNRQLFKDLESYDAVLFHGIEMNHDDLPPSRSSHQRYIYFSWESPASRPISGRDFILTPNYFNWTMSYRLDSDIIRPYGRIRDIVTQKLVSPPNNSDSMVTWKNFNHSSYSVSTEELSIISGKKRIAAWFVSHCGTESQREILVNELKRYFEVDIYGSCGKLKCNKDDQDECYDLLEKEYFFYFSFENTLCKDYVTEKTFLPMRKYVVPVVYGGANYSKFLPPHSYINIMDFNTTDELAKFLLRLSKNATEYASYFWWKKDYVVVEDTAKSTLCDLCEKLHNESLPNKSLENFNSYYLRDQCYTPYKLTWYQHRRYFGK